MRSGWKFEPIPDGGFRVLAPDGSVFCDKGDPEVAQRLLSYENPDSRCTYPFAPSGAGYCWSWAHHVDGTEGFEDMTKRCPTCELWKTED